MATDGEHDADARHAGRPSRWIGATLAALRGEGDADVPCGTCTGCCTSSQFVLVEPDEHEALAAIPPALLFPAPRLPEGYRLLGYDERGRCPMLVDDGCSIYAARPRTCRTYDCRVLAAAGLDPAEGDPSKAAVAERVRRWRWDDVDPSDRAVLDAVRGAEAFVRERADALPAEARPPTTTARAIVAVALHELFLDPSAPPPAPEAVAVHLARHRSGGRHLGPGGASAQVGS